MTRFTRTAVLGALVALSARGASAQSKPTITIAGFVRDSAGRPLAGAEVWLVGGSKTVTGPGGAFRFDGIKNAVRGWIAARHIGHLPVQTSVAAEPGTTSAVTIVMAARPYDLPELTVRAAEKAQRSRLIEFVWRTRGTGARFVSRDDIERSGATRLGQVVLRYLPFKDAGTMDEPGGMGPYGSQPSGLMAMPIVYYSSPWALPGSESQPRVEWYASSETRWFNDPQITRSCPPAVSVNGGGIAPGRAINDFEPDEVEALEIYRDHANSSIEFGASSGTACGVVVVWLKAFVRAQVRP